MEKSRADLMEESRENIEFIIEYLKRRLQVVNTGAINARNFETENYDDLLDIFEFVSRKESFTMSEIESIIAEIGQIRKK